MYERWIELGLEVERLTADRDGLREQIREFTGGVSDADTEIREITAETTRLEERLVDLEVDFVNDYLLNAPLLDFMAPTLTVQQTITPNVVDDVNFTRVPKMDRCQTCHLAIDREGFEDYPQPYRTHPNLDTYVGSASPHPIGSTGCSVCHDGMGQSVGFVHSSHTPTGDEQTHRWEEEYGWEVPHLWDYPMLPTEMTEASCAKCHKDTVHVPEASSLNLAYGMYERAGCYACHRTRGFDDLRKPGPDLTRIGAKLEPEWVANWIRDPRAVKSSTWMPRVWYNSNTSSPEDARRNEVEIDSVVAYLFANSEEHEFAVRRPPRGSAARGEEIVASVGCLACHIVGDESRLEAGPRRTFGQPLQSIGDKTSYEWLFDWVRDPRHFSSETYMPDLRLTDREVADVAAYLSGLTGSAGPAGAGDLRRRRGRRGAPRLRALGAADGRGGGTGRRHVVRGAADRSRAPRDRPLRLLQLPRDRRLRPGDAADRDRAHRGREQAPPAARLRVRPRHSAHEDRVVQAEEMRDPRAFDRSRVLQPLEKLRMPDFGMSEEEVTLFATAISSFQTDVQPLAAQVPRSARHDALREGRNLVRRRNCVGCHEIEADGGDYRVLLDDPSLAPPMLTPEGAKVRPEWLYAFLREPITIRPWLDVRMPSFGLEDDHWNGVLDYFAANLRRRRALPDPRSDDPGRRCRPRDASCSTCCGASSVTCSTPSRSTSRRTTSLPTCAWRPSASSRSGFWTGCASRWPSSPAPGCRCCGRSCRARSTRSSARTGSGRSRRFATTCSRSGAAPVPSEPATSQTERSRQTGGAFGSAEAVRQCLAVRRTPERSASGVSSQGEAAQGTRPVTGARASPRP